MGASPTNNKRNADSFNSTCMKLLQLWLTSFAIGIPSLRLLFFFDFRYSEIIIAVFLTMLLFGTMFILDANDRLWRVDDVQPVQPCNVVTVTDGERTKSQISSNYQNKKFETKLVTDSAVTPMTKARIREAVIV
ncbi:hypothetical protein Bhyg_00846 [Pseudolycoriella hygida]|uniref:Uncharacterized protein n=1 Tax=Pseudolycoriella hygida TaxID=35572 RepID=A0A9Q0S5B5_9DIPT|nr:hypothetical protein Bhyg_00846 [Pseudolycoriella hygida]